MNKIVLLKLARCLVLSAAFGLTMMVRVYGDSLTVRGELNAAADWETGRAGNSGVYLRENLLYVPIGPKISSSEVRSGTQASRDKVHEIIMEQLREMDLKLGEEARKLGEEGISRDILVLLLDEQGSPILPDAEKVKQQPSVSSLTGTSSNELSFTFNSPAFPWSTADLLTLQANINTFYPVIKNVYGSPAFPGTINIRLDPTLTTFSGLYYPSTNELVLRDANTPDVLVHEMIHAFRDDFLLTPGTYEEGMTRAAEIEVFSRTGMTHPSDDKHSYTYDVYYAGLDTPAIGAHNGNIFMGYIGVLERYQLSGYAWAKALIENSNFLVNFNQQLYPAMSADVSVGSNLTALISMGAAAQPSIEGKPYQNWYAQQANLDAAPPQGYNLHHRINQGTVDYFHRDVSGIETMQSGATLQWQEYDNQGALLLSGSEATGTNGFVFWIGWPSSYQGRARFVVTAQSPDGPITDSSMRTFGSEAGVFGYLPKSNTGTVTFTSLDNVVSPVAVDVVNGAFAADTLGPVRGRFRADFTNGTNSFSVYFNKDASPYFLPMAFTIQGRVTDLAGIALKGVTLTLSGASTATTVSGPDGKFYFPHLEGDQNFTVTPTLSGTAFSPASTTITLNEKVSGINFASQKESTATTGTISINGGAAVTTSTAVTLSLSAPKTGSIFTSMRFSNDNINWGPWRAYAASASYKLTNGDGTKAVYAQFRDAQMNISATVSDTIILQTVTNNRISEDFSSLTAASRFTKLKGGTWSVAGGMFKLSKPSTAVTTHNANISVHTTAISNDFELSATAKVSGTSSTSNDFSIVFGLKDANNYYYANFSEANDSASNGLFKVAAGVRTQMADFTSVIKPNTGYTIKIVRLGNEITVSRDGTVVGAATDSTYPSGKVGFGSRNDSCQFDNLMVP